MMEKTQDYYQILGITRDANLKTIKDAYRKLAKQYHPDVNQDPDAERQFKAINQAYEILSDPQSRAIYDQGGYGGLNNNFGQSGFWQQGGNWFDDVIKQFFTHGGEVNNRTHWQFKPTNGANRTMVLKIDFNQSVLGSTLNFKFKYESWCTACKGSGAKDQNSWQQCHHCQGQKVVVQRFASPFGLVEQEVGCNQCHGQGKIIKHKCNQCHGKTVEWFQKEASLQLPPGVERFSQFSFENYGHLGTNGGKNGDLVVVIEIANHPYYQRDDNNLILKMPVSVFDIWAAKTISVPTFYGDYQLKCNPDWDYHEVVKIKNYGIRKPNAKAGDLHLIIEPYLPKLAKKAQQVVQQLNFDDDKMQKWQKQVYKSLS